MARKTKPNTVTLEPFKPGDFISLPNCVGYFRVIERTAPRLYKIDFKGREIVIERRLGGAKLRPATRPDGSAW